MICVLLITIFSSNLANVAGAYATTVALSNFTIYNIRFPSLFMSVNETIVPTNDCGTGCCTKAEGSVRFYISHFYREALEKMQG